MLFKLLEWEPTPGISRLATVTNNDPDVHMMEFPDEAAADQYAKNQQIGGCYWLAVRAEPELAKVRTPRDIKIDQMFDECWKLAAHLEAQL